MADWRPLKEAKFLVDGLLKVVTEAEGQKELADNGELAALFQEMDADGSGGLDREEVGLLLGKLDFDLSSNAFDLLWDEMDTDKSGDIDFHEFKEWFLRRVAANAELLSFQQRRARAARFACSSGVRQGPLWDISQAQRGLRGTTGPECVGSGFTVPEEWEKRVSAIMQMGCGRAMAIEALRQCGGHGGKARAMAADRLNVGPSDLPNLNPKSEALSDAEVRFRMQAHFLHELQRVDKAALEHKAVGQGRLAGGTLDQILGRVDLDYQAPKLRNLRQLEGP
jgi:hypothetical protein